MAKKLYHKIGEACKILDVKPFVLRYWETEFPFLNPEKSKSGQRIYSQPDLEIIRRINKLLNVEGYTIAGARKKLRTELEAGPAPSEADTAPKVASEGKGGKAAAAKQTLDTEAQKKIERFRTGIEEGLRQAREILDHLGPQASSQEAPKSRSSAA